MSEPILVITIAAAVLLALIFIKLYILFRSARRKTLRRWFYFSQQEIIEAPTPRAAQLRRAQNALTIVFLILTAITGLLLFLLSR